MTNTGISKYHWEARTSDVDRRGVLGLLAAAGSLALPTVLGPRAHADDRLTVYEWGGFEVPELYPAYFEVHGEPDFTLYANQMEMLSKLSHGFQVDIMHTCTESLERMSDLGMLRPIDTGRLSNWDKVFPRLRELSDIRDKDGNVVMVPTDWGNSSIIYRTDVIDVPPDDISWCLLFDEQYEGRLAAVESEEAVLAAGLCHGFGAESFNMTDEMLEEIRPLIERQARLARFYSSDETEIVNALANGEVVAALGWSTGVKSLKDQGVPVAYANPKEGIVNWICGLSVLPSSEADEDLIYAFIDAWIDQRAGQFLIEDYGMGHSNAESFKVSDSAVVEALGFPSDPVTVLDRGITFRPIDPVLGGKMINMINEARLGS